MKFVAASFSILLLTFALTGCKHEEANPEAMDPIYQDLSKRAAEAQKAYDDEMKKQVDLNNKLQKAQPNSIDLKTAQHDLLRSQSIALQQKQMALYYSIRAKRRMLVDHITYHQAFQKNQPWPDPKEYSEYLVNIRLQEAPRNWNTHVPKLQDRLLTTQATEKAPSKSKE